MENKIVSIHQPNFFPWLGFFHKILHSDVFVYLDNVKMNPDQMLIKRVKIISNSIDQWLTIPVQKKTDNGFQPIHLFKIDNHLDFAKKHLKTIELNYKKAPFYNEVFPLIMAYYSNTSEFISERNIAFVETVCDKLLCSTHRIRSTSFNCSNSSNELLIEIIHKIGGDTYLCGGGSAGYQIDELFKDAGIKLIYQNFQHPIYPQFSTKEFIPGVSIIDSLMNVGFEGVTKLL